MVRAVDDQGRRVSYRYDEGGRLEASIDLGGNAWSYAYDESGRLIGAADPRGGRSLAVEYDSGGRVLSASSPGASYSYLYRGLETAVTDGSGHVNLFGRNEEGITVGVENALGVSTELQLDGAGRVRRILRNGIVERTMGYDEQGRLSRIATGKAQQREHFYNAKGRLVEVHASGRGPARVILKRAYDEAGNLLWSEDSEGQSRFRYSPQGDVVEAQLSDGRSYRFAYDADGQIVSVSDPSGETTRFTYQADGKPSQTVFADGERHLYSYDALGVRTAAEFRREDGAAARVDYSHDSMGSITQVQVTNQDGSISGNRLHLDARQRPTLVEYFGGRRIAFEYDDSGNLLAARAVDGKGDESVEFEYDALNRLSGVRTDEGRELRYEYAPGEADLRLQSDAKTAPSQGSLSSSGATFGSGMRILRNRTQRSSYGSVRFDASSMAFLPAGGEGLAADDAVPMRSWERMRLLTLADKGGRTLFEQPSSIFFLPAEYASLNCCFECSVMFGWPCICVFPVNHDGTCSECIPILLPPPPPPCLVSEIQYDDPDQGWTPISSTLHVLKGTTVNFRALKSGGGSWPSGKPVWGGAATGTGPATSVTFNGSTGNQSVSARCDNAKTVTINVFTLQGRLTPMDNFAGRSQTRLGIAEVVSLDFATTPSGITASQIGGLNWKRVSGGGTLNAHPTIGTGTYTAPSTAGTTRLKLEIQSGPSKGLGPDYTRSIVTPSNSTMQQMPGSGIWHVQGQASIGFRGIMHMRPTDVSFSNVDWREGFTRAIATGYHAPVNGLPHQVGIWIPIGNCSLLTGCQVLGFDTVSMGPFPGPYSNGSFTWPIPWEYKVGQGPATQFTVATHHSDIFPTGRITISKKGVGPFSRNLNDPSSTY